MFVYEHVLHAYTCIIHVSCAVRCYDCTNTQIHIRLLEPVSSFFVMTGPRKAPPPPAAVITNYRTVWLASVIAAVATARANVLNASIEVSFAPDQHRGHVENYSPCAFTPVVLTGAVLRGWHLPSEYRRPDARVDLATFQCVFTRNIWPVYLNLGVGTLTITNLPSVVYCIRGNAGGFRHPKEFFLLVILELYKLKFCQFHYT